MGMRLIYIHVAVLKHVYSKWKCHNLHNVELIFVYVQEELHKQASEFSSRLE